MDEVEVVVFLPDYYCGVLYLLCLWVSSLTPASQSEVGSWSPYRPVEAAGETFGANSQDRMTRKSRNQDDGKSRKRSQMLECQVEVVMKMLKPVVEKKRRDRINHSLAELRRLLLFSTSDPRLQNPKIEKAEILDLAVEYLKKWTERRDVRNAVCVSLPHADPNSQAPWRTLGPTEPSAPPLLSIESAGFQQCVSQLSSYMQKITPAQSAHLMEGLKCRSETSRQPKPAEAPDPAPVETICPSDSRGDSPWFLFSSHSPFQPLSCSTPCHEYLSPPPSPWFSPPFPTYGASPPFPSLTCPLAFPPSLSPPSSFFSVSPKLPHTGPVGLHIPLLTSLSHPLNPPQREESAADSVSTMWRPWMR
ncbi:transcription factor HES-7 isoform X2 [Austrofundulus limnaeus]|uniref:Transcription factor HES-7 isoform X2 n=1 Tax=Austrofundulus limnaeus TaxID=52670 RepID=A0A2I4CHY3_AUSLI|nr:PREDICTED: transcription factor HES-7-like isoform X2 [Austrofundulus limnaeus]